MRKITVAVDVNNDGVIYVDGRLRGRSYGEYVGFDDLERVAHAEPFVFEFVEVGDQIEFWPPTLAEVEAMVAEGGDA